jgi:hypothetical protein
MRCAILFGDNCQWAITEDDACLQFHPDMINKPDVKSTHIWKEAWEEVEKRGGYYAVVKYLRGEELVSANGQEGFLIKTIEDDFMFRSYNEDHTFVDYKILHADLLIKIIDSTAVFDKINGTIDYIDYEVMD